MRENVLMTGSIRLGERDVDLGDARGNVLNAMAERDNVVPPRRRRAGHASSSATRRAARSCGCPAATSPSAPAGARVKHTMPRLAEWIIDHSDERPDPKER